MPAKSAKQYNFMQMMAHSPEKKKKGKGIGPSPEVAEEFIHKTSKSKRSQFAREKK
jgi:hypothetical protein